MAQGTQTPPENEPKHKSGFHYYSGGEVKELSSTKVSPWMWIMSVVVIIGGLGYFFYGGGFPGFGSYRPVGSTPANLAKLSGELNAQKGVQYASLDLTRLPRPDGQTLDQTVENGAQIYQNYCIGCHGPNQDGNGVSAASLNPKPRNLRDAPFMQAMSYQRISTSLHKGVYGTAMPRWENTLSEAEIQEVAAYVFSLTSPAPSTQPAGAASTDNDAGGSSQYANGTQNSPAPITPAIGGNPAAHTTTAPPSLSGAPTGTDPLAGGRNANSVQTPKPAPPTPPSSSGPTPSNGTAEPAGGR